MDERCRDENGLRAKAKRRSPCRGPARKPMKFSQHNSSPFSGFFPKRPSFRGHLYRSGAFIRSSTARFLSQDSRNAYDNTTSSGRAPLYRQSGPAYAHIVHCSPPIFSRPSRRGVAKHANKMVSSAGSRWRPPPRSHSIPQKVGRAGGRRG